MEYQQVVVYTIVSMASSLPSTSTSAKKSNLLKLLSRKLLVRRTETSSNNSCVCFASTGNNNGKGRISTEQTRSSTERLAPEEKENEGRFTLTNQECSGRETTGLLGAFRPSWVENPGNKFLQPLDSLRVLFRRSSFDCQL